MDFFTFSKNTLVAFQMLLEAVTLQHKEALELISAFKKDHYSSPTLPHSRFIYEVAAIVLENCKNFSLQQKSMTVTFPDPDLSES